MAGPTARRCGCRRARRAGARRSSARVATSSATSTCAPSCAGRGRRPRSTPTDGKLKPYQVDHWCHTEDLTCPGGDACEHRRCMNGAHLSWVSPRVNSLRMQIRKRRRELWLSGQQTAWELSVAEEADARLAEAAA